MTDLWLYLHDARERDLMAEARLAMHRRAAAELRRRDHARARTARWARVTAALRRRPAGPVPCPTC